MDIPRSMMKVMQICLHKSWEGSMNLIHHTGKFLFFIVNSNRGVNQCWVKALRFCFPILRPARFCQMLWNKQFIGLRGFRKRKQTMHASSGLKISRKDSVTLENRFSWPRMKCHQELTHSFYSYFGATEVFLLLDIKYSNCDEVPLNYFSVKSCSGWSHACVVIGLKLEIC